MSNDHANSRIAAARKEGYDEGRADVLAKVKQVREWVERSLRSKPNPTTNGLDAGYLIAMGQVLTELNTHFPKAKE